MSRSRLVEQAHQTGSPKPHSWPSTLDRTGHSPHSAAALRWKSVAWHGSRETKIRAQSKSSTCKHTGPEAATCAEFNTQRDHGFACGKQMKNSVSENRWELVVKARARMSRVTTRTCQRRFPQSPTDPEAAAYPPHAGGSPAV